MSNVKSLAELRKSRTTSLESLQKQAAALNSKKSEDKEADDRFWQCKTDEAGNGSAVIRFLPACKTEDVAFVKLFHHGFQCPATNKWYIENSLTTLNEKDPVTELNNTLWNTKDKDKIEIAKSQKRKMSYYSNILVIKDPANPENEGKVKIFRYNKTIFDMIMAKTVKEEVDPEMEDEVEVTDPFNPFDFWEGANFNLKIKKKDKYSNFDDSKFLKQKPVAASDEEIEAIWDKCQPLQWIIAPDQFKPYAELEKRLHIVLGVAGSGKATKKAEETTLDDDDEEFLKSNAETKEAEPEVKEVKKEVKKTAAKVEEVKEDKIDPADLPDAGSDDSDLDYFKSLAE